MAKKKGGIKSPKTMKTSEGFNKTVKTIAKSVLLMTPIPRNKSWYTKKENQKRNKNECVKSGGVWVKGACKSKTKFKPGSKVRDPISKR